VAALAALLFFVRDYTFVSNYCQVGFRRTIIMSMNEPTMALCPRFHRAVELIGRRWTGALLQMLMDGRRRYSDLKSSVPHISDRMLSERLRELEVEGIVRRVVTPDTPVRVEYELTERGSELREVLQAISAWAEEWLPVPPS
jgi:DNA-binding HxlR family transcriptional regulator